MAITSRGYSGTINYEDWAQISTDMGFRYGVLEATGFQASAGAGTRQVKVGTGTAWGAGILDVSDASVTLTGSAVSGQSRWDMVALRRDWSTGSSALVLVQGDTKAIPSRNTTPGTKDDQPLWLVRWAAGQAAPQEFVDLRVWNGDGGMVANDLLVRNYMNRLGTVLWIQGQFWVRTFNTSGNPAWMSAPLFSGTVTAGRVQITNAGDVSGTGGNPGLIIGSEAAQNMGVDNNEIQARNNGQPSNLALNYDGGDLTIGSDTAVVRVPGDVRVSDPTVTTNPATKRYVDSADNAMKTRVDKLDTVYTETTGISRVSGWEVSNIVLKKMGGVGFMRATFTRTGGNIESGRGGDIPNEQLGSMTFGSFRSSNQVGLTSGSAGPVASGYMNPDGRIYLAAVPPGYTITSGDQFQMSGTYLL